MGEDMVDRIEKELHWKHAPTPTALMHIHGYKEKVNWEDPFYFYGSDAEQLRKRINGSAGEWISESLKIHQMQVRWAVEHEMARTVEDVLSRRTRALLLNAKESVRICREVAGIMAQALGKDQQWIEEEVAHYTQLAEQYLLKQN
jgi:glycerol-3-phosphate dehydrogenase